MVINDAREFGRAVALFRGESTSQQALAQRIGVSRTVIALLEQGRRLPSPDMVERIRIGCGLKPLRWAPMVGGTPVLVDTHCLTYYLTWKQAKQEKESRQRWQLVINVKNIETYTAGNGTKHVAAEFAAKKVRHWLRRTEFLEEAIFVPVPRSLRSVDHGYDAWGTYALAEALATQTGGAVEPWIERVMELRKSSDPDRKHPRPTVGEHRATMEYVGPHPVPGRIVLVDDLVTRGSTLVACASLLVDAGWEGSVPAIAAGYVPRSGVGQDQHEVTLRWDGRRSAPVQL